MESVLRLGDADAIPGAGRMGSQATAMLPLEAVGEFGLPEAETAWRQSGFGVEYLQVCTWRVADQYEPGT